MSDVAARIWEWLPARTDSRRVTLPSTITAALDIPTGEVSRALLEMERHGHVVRDSATGTRSGWHRGTPPPSARTELVAPARSDWTLFEDTSEGLVVSADDTPPRVWWSAASQWLIVPHRFGGCYDVVSVGATGADVVEELTALPADAVELRPVGPATEAGLDIAERVTHAVLFELTGARRGISVDVLASLGETIPIVIAAQVAAALADRLVPTVPETVEPPQAPRRDDEVAAWLKRMRDRDREDGHDSWGVLDSVLDDYRLHADTGTPLDQHACEGSHCCSDPATRSLSTDTEEAET